MTIEQLFFELIRVSIGVSGCLGKTPTNVEWKALYDMAKKQSLVGVCFAGVQKLVLQEQVPEEMLYLTWMGMAAKIQQRNEVVNRQCAELQRMLTADGVRSCIIKGQDVGSLYRVYANHNANDNSSNPSNNTNLSMLRQSGDIDVWVDRDVSEIVEYAIRKGWHYHATTAHVECDVVDDTSTGSAQGTEVELHPQPAQLMCPWNNAKLQKWFGRFDETSNEFYCLFLLIHMYHHLLYEGIGLRQFMDYYFVLVASQEHKQSTMTMVKRLGMEYFVGGVMYVMHEVFGLPEDELLIKPNEKAGRILINEIMQGGNFGHHDARDTGGHKRNSIVRVANNFVRNLRLFRFGPTEILCTPFWRLWHYVWMKRRNYR